MLRWEQLERERIQQGAVRHLLVSDEDVMRCFNLNDSRAARTRVVRFIKDGLASKQEEVVKDGHINAIYRKTDVVMIS